MNFLFSALMITGWQWPAIIIVVILLFGGKKIPELMRGLGKGMKEFKKGMKEAEGELDDIKKELNSDEDKKE